LNNKTTFLIGIIGVSLFVVSSVLGGFFNALSDNTQNKALKVAKQQGSPKELDDVMAGIKRQNDEVDDILARIEKKVDLIKNDENIRDRTIAQYEMKKSRNQNRHKILIKKFGKDIGTKLIRKELFVGMTYEMLKEIKSSHDKKTSNVSNGKETIKLYYGKKKNRLGNDSYEFEVTLQDGKVTGWKDLTNVGTRSK